MRYILRHPNETRPSLLVHTAAKLEQPALDRLRRDMHGVGCSTGILFTPERTAILRDKFTSADVDSIEADPSLETLKVMASIGEPEGEPFDARVERWLRTLAESWSSAIPEDPEIARELVHDVVPAASGSLIST